MSGRLSSYFPEVGWPESLVVFLNEVWRKISSRWSKFHWTMRWVFYPEAFRRILLRLFVMSIRGHGTIWTPHWKVTGRDFVANLVPEYRCVSYRDDGQDDRVNEVGLFTGIFFGDRVLLHRLLLRVPCEPTETQCPRRYGVASRISVRHALSALGRHSIERYSSVFTGEPSRFNLKDWVSEALSPIVLETLMFDLESWIPELRVL